MTEALITDLAKIGALKVISRSSAMRYKGTDKSLAEIARELNVDALVEGSAQRVAGSVRIMAQLIDPKTEQALWAESYERDLENVLLLWSEVAQAIAGEVQVALTPEETKRLAGVRPVNPEAHDAYLKGSYYWKNLTPANIDTAESYFELALEKDPSYSPAYAGLSWVWSARQQMGITPPHEAGPKAKAAALKAVALDDGSAGAHEALAVVTTYSDWNWAGAEPEWRLALELDPNFANAHAYYKRGKTTIPFQSSQRVYLSDKKTLTRFPGLIFGFGLVSMGQHSVNLCKSWKSNPMKHTTPFILYLRLLAAHWAGYGVAQERPPSPVRYTEAKEQTVRRQLRLPGSVEARTSSLVASEVEGLVVSLVAHEGDEVKKGQAIVELRKDHLQLQLEAAEAELREADAR